MSQTTTTTAFLDEFPVATGHTLIIPKRHVASIFDLPAEEFHDLWAQVAEVRRLLVALRAPDGFNERRDGRKTGASCLQLSDELKLDSRRSPITNVVPDPLRKSLWRRGSESNTPEPG